MRPGLRIDSLPDDAARTELANCCGAQRWVDEMSARRPFGTRDAMLAAAADVWATMTRDDVLEALAHHPKIGGDLEALRARYPTRHLDWSDDEQSGVEQADDGTLVALRDANVEYEQRFGYIFVVCATGKSAAEMLDILRDRLHNDPDREWRVAADEQLAITRIRIRKLEAT
ncbi:MAG: 2-oxo-4-hydroxy-4-carboxy-5-ureidoimidazoline decarboxylase [Planctomycetes bacterium]|nr:2-oxo-4-hydroxy-4-carboxy-5-ureidoimidazoline decarboxylase [Planctomycetota bacterium]